MDLHRIVNKRLNLLSTSLCMMSLTAMTCVPATVNAAEMSVQQNNLCKGVVKDASGVPVIGASVAVKNSQIGTVTDVNGNFQLKGVKNGDVIRISYIGYEPVETI